MRAGGEFTSLDMHRPSTYAAAALSPGRPARAPARAQRASAAAGGAFPYPIHQGRLKGALPNSAWFTRPRQRVVRGTDELGKLAWYLHGHDDPKVARQ